MGNDFPNKVFGAFTVALAASVWALFAEIGRPYLPSIPIVLFGVFLYANRDAISSQGGDSLRDAPYFLGFLLTMFGLFKLFNDVSFNFALFGRNPALLTEQVGGAVLTTIVGLFVRQALILLVPDVEPKEDDRLAALAAAITSHAVAFELARRDFFREMGDEARSRTERLDAIERRLVANGAPAASGPDVRDGDDPPPSVAETTAPPPPRPAPGAARADVASGSGPADLPAAERGESTARLRAQPPRPDVEAARALDEAWSDVGGERAAPLVDAGFGQVREP